MLDFGIFKGGAIGTKIPTGSLVQVVAARKTDNVTMMATLFDGTTEYPGDSP